jgi:MFS family permease
MYQDFPQIDFFSGFIEHFVALATACFAACRRGLATGIVTMGTGVGLSITRLVLPYLIKHFNQDGWRYAWFLMGAVVFICSFVCCALLCDNLQKKALSRTQATAMSSSPRAKKLLSFPPAGTLPLASFIFAVAHNTHAPEYFRD